MAVVVYLRQFVNERLTAAAEEIFGAFQKSIVEYEDEIDRQRRLLDVFLKPQVKLNRIGLSQQPVKEEEEEALAHQQQLCVQEWSASLNQEDPETLPITERQDELCTREEGEQLVLKQETDAFMFIPTHEESDRSEDQTLYFSTDDSQRVMLEKPLGNFSVTNFVLSEPNADQQRLSLYSHEAESQNQEGGKNPDHKTNCHLTNTSNSTLPLSHSRTQMFKCNTCEKAFKCKSYLQRHLLVHKCTKPHTCKICGKSFQYNSYLKVHIRIHTGEKPYTCNTCGKGFRCSTDMKCHMRIHTGDKPYQCQACGKRFRDMSAVKGHIKIHTGEKSFTCKICEKAFSGSSYLKVHMRTHTGERPYTCKTCGKDFRSSSNLKGHMKRLHQ
ncbi:zinc finger protein 625-like [Clinocottus analis]|uniref:zinc finger protein 625-like n=1 Tax=Clinocottus analis TaxID=304258 RepID=UPI0035BF94B2